MDKEFEVMRVIRVPDGKLFVQIGKRRFVFLILTGAVGAFILSYILPHFFPETIELKVIGWVIPGLIASQFEKQGPIITLSSMAIVLTLLFFLGKIFYMILKFIKLRKKDNRKWVKQIWERCVHQGVFITSWQNL